MKKVLSLCLTMLISVLFIVPVYADTHQLSDTDVKIAMLEDIWYVFTRDNIKDNPELVELGLTYDYMYDLFLKNDAYMDAVLFYESGEFLEFFVGKKPVDSGMINLTNYDHDVVLELATKLASKYETDKYSTYSTTYKFAIVEYFDSNYNYYVCDYVTVVNGDCYTFKFQSACEFDDDQYNEMKWIINGITFDIDETLQEPQPATVLSNVIEKVIIGAVVGGLVGGIIAIVKRRR